MRHDAASFEKNYILRSLQSDVIERLLPHSEKVQLPRGAVLFKPGDRLRHVYFPSSALISIVSYSVDGHGAEAAVIGNEGATSIPGFFGTGRGVFENLVQMAGGATRISIGAMKTEVARGGAMHDLSLEFVEKLFLQIGQTTLCNRHHTTEQRMARWLLMCLDRSGRNARRLTHEFLGLILGVNRSTVTLTALSLQNAGLLSYKHGKIKILDRELLKECACECYQIIRNAYQEK